MGSGRWSREGMFYPGQGGALSIVTSWGRDEDEMTSPGERLLQDRSPRGVSFQSRQTGGVGRDMRTRGPSSRNTRSN